MILQSRVQNFLDLSIQPVDLIDKQDVIGLKIGQYRCQIPCLFNCRSCCNTQINAHFVGNDRGQCGLAQSRRTIEQDVIQGIATALCCLNVDRQVFFHLILSDIFHKRLRAQGHFHFVVFFHFTWCHHPLLKLHIAGLDHLVSLLSQKLRCFPNSCNVSRISSDADRDGSSFATMGATSLWV